MKYQVVVVEGFNRGLQRFNDAQCPGTCKLVVICVMVYVKQLS